MTAALPEHRVGPWTYSCFDFRLRSEIALNELISAEYPSDRRPLIEVRFGELPEILAGGQAAGYGLQVADGAVMLTVTGAARFLIRDGREIVVDPAPGATERTVRLFLLGSALGILCHQRGLLPLHANAIIAGGSAVAFAGPSGAGKSTLAAHFQHAGYDVLCDDVCMIGFDDAGRPLAWPGLPRLKLWGDAAAAFGHEPQALDRVIEDMDKYQVPLRPVATPGPVPFRRLYVLSRADGEADARVHRLAGGRAMDAVMSQTYRGQYLNPMGLAARHFRQCAALIAQAEVYDMRRVWGYDVFAREAAAIERHVADARGG